VGCELHGVMLQQSGPMQEGGSYAGERGGRARAGEVAGCSSEANNLARGTRPTPKHEGTRPDITFGHQGTRSDIKLGHERTRPDMRSGTRPDFRVAVMPDPHGAADAGREGNSPSKRNT